MSIVLCGLPGSGKTTLGSLLAERLSLDFIDTDRLIEMAFRGDESPLSCKEIFRKHGEGYFRELERKVILRLNKKSPRVISLGGGALMEEANVRHLKSLGKVVFLNGTVELLYERASKYGTPAYLDEENPRKAFEELAAIREPYYKEAADFILEIDGKTKEQLIKNLCNMARNHGE